MAQERLDPADVSTWLTRGRTPEHAAAIAAAWRDFPDLPPDAPLQDRTARGRERIAAMRPINDAIRDQTEAQRQATNFAFTEQQVQSGRGNDRDIAILHGHEQYGYDWDVSCRYADGWYAAHVGWPHHYPDGVPSNAPLALLHAAYDQGFTDGGGDRTDLFDAARRSNLAILRESNFPPPAPTATPSGRPLPSAWPKPTDEPRPARWSRRLAIIDAADVATGDPSRTAWDFLTLILSRPGADKAMIVILTPAGFVVPDGLAADHRSAESPTIGAIAAGHQLTQLLAGREFDDVLIALQDDGLRLLDEIADVLPLCRTMERTRNTRLQQRAHLRTWLDRGYAANENMAAGHIRWGKAIHGLTGKLGEFTARHVGPGPNGGHLIRVETTIGTLATGYADADGAPLSPEVIVSSKARLRPTIASTLRTFGAATTLMGTLDLRAA